MNKNITLKDLGAILKKLENIEAKLQQADLTDYVSEEDAKKIFRRGTTWFWEQRQRGLKYYKVGGEVYFKKQDLIEFIESRASNNRFED
jgi:hypothetical protein